VILTARERNSDEFKSGELHEKHGVATWNLGPISAFAYKIEENQDNLCRESETMWSFTTTSPVCLQNVAVGHSIKRYTRKLSSEISN
jgi:hypothetical protein